MSEPVSFRVEEDVLAEIDTIAASLDKTRNWIVNDALTRYVELHRWQVDEIEKGIEDSDAGRSQSEEDVRALFKNKAKPAK